MEIKPADLKILKAAQVVVIVGLPASGKTTVALALHEEILSEHSLYQTDDYIDFGFKESLYAMMKEMEYDKNPLKLIEGVQGFRFLRKNQESRKWKVDVVIVVDCDHKVRQKRYMARGKDNLNSGFDRNLETVFKDYLGKSHAAGDPLPHFINIKT